MKKILLSIMAILLCIVAFGQRLDSAINHIFEPLEKSQISTGLLIDRAYCTENPLNFNGSSTSDTLKNYLQWYSLYSTMGTAEVDSTNDVLASIDAWKSTAEAIKNSGAIPIPILHMEFNMFTTDSVTLNNLIYIQNDQIHNAQGQSGSPYDVKEVFAAVPYSNPDKDELDVKFRVPTQLYFSNTGKTIQSITIDFDNGSGSQNVSVNQDFVVSYSSFGMKNIETTVTYTDQTSYQSKSQLMLKEEASTTSAMGLYGYDDSPDHIEYDINSNRSDSLKATLQIEYACGSQKLDKPLIIVEGFNPNGFNELDYGDFWDIITAYEADYLSAPLSNSITTLCRRERL